MNEAEKQQLAEALQPKNLNHKPSEKTILSFSVKANELQRQNSNAFDYFQIGFANISTNGYRKSKLRSFHQNLLSHDDYETGIETGKVQYLKKCEELHTYPVNKLVQILDKQAIHELNKQHSENNNDGNDSQNLSQPNNSGINASPLSRNDQQSMNRKQSKSSFGNNKKFPIETYTVDLGHYGIGNDGAIAFSEILKVNQHIETCLLNNNDIYNSGAMKLCDALNSNRQTMISTLDLSFNKLDITHDAKNSIYDFKHPSKTVIDAINAEIYGYNKGFDNTKLQQTNNNHNNNNNNNNNNINNNEMENTLQELQSLQMQQSTYDDNNNNNNNNNNTSNNKNDNDNDESEFESLPPSFALSLRNLLSGVCPLTCLHLKGCNLKDSDMQLICLGLSENTRLQELDISKNDITDVSCKYMTNMLHENVTLLILDLSWNRITHNGTLELMIGLKENTGLKSLNISWCGIDDEPKCANLISQFIESHDYIESLDISNNFLGHICGQSLINHLQNGSNLKKIDLSNNQFGVKSYKMAIDLDNALTKSRILEKVFDGTEMAYISAALQENSQQYDSQIEDIIHNSLNAQEAMLDAIVENSKESNEKKPDKKAKTGKPDKKKKKK